MNQRTVERAYDRPTWFLMRTAQQVSGPIISPTGKEVEVPSPECGTEAGECWLCGAETERGFLKKKVIKPTFTDGPLAKAPYSDVVCEACTWAISHRPLRNYSLFATMSQLEFPSRQRSREILLDPPDEPFMLVLAESGQKWLHFKAKVNLGVGKTFQVLLEEAPVTVACTFRLLLDNVEELYNGGFTKTEIASSNYHSHRIQEFGIQEWDELEKQVSRYRGGRLLDLALFIAQRDESK